MMPAYLLGLAGDEWPRFQAAEAAGDTATLNIVPDADLAWFRGHFPGHPVLPGVVQMHWASLWGRGLFGIPGHFQRVENLKFEHIIVPGVELTVTLDYTADRGRLVFGYRDDDRRYSSGRLYFSA